VFQRQKQKKNKGKKEGILLKYLCLLLCFKDWIFHIRIRGADALIYFLEINTFEAHQRSDSFIIQVTKNHKGSNGISIRQIWQYIDTIIPQSTRNLHLNFSFKDQQLKI